MVSFSLRQRISLPPPTGPLSGVLSFESIRPMVPNRLGKFITEKVPIRLILPRCNPPDAQDVRFRSA
jgi:hypothetical protein